MNLPTLAALLADLRQPLKAARVRAPVLITGTAEATLHAVLQYLAECGDDGLWLSSRAPASAWSMPVGKANHELGRDADLVIIDLFDGWAVDSIAALAGVVRAGGLLLFLAPPVEQWADFPDPHYAHITVEPYGVAGVRRNFLQRMARFFAHDARLANISAVHIYQPDFSRQPSVAPLVPDEAGCLTTGQRQVVDSILTLAAFPHAPPWVVQADRGRGKSAALGLVAHQLAAKGCRILVTSPRPEAAETLLRFACHESVQWLAPDQLLQQLPPADLLLVDEAAALSPVLLMRLLAHYPRSVLATTVQGYEGTGQGFATRFARHLDQQHRGWRLLRLEQPIRWAEDDPLEAFINNIFLLNACHEPEAPQPDIAADWSLLDLTPQLSDLDENLLRSAHGLLVAAHYRTRPSDLRTLLDGPNMRTFAVMQSGQMIAVALVAEEGCLPPDLADAILAGRRRPHGHVLPQSLAVHLNVEQALISPLWRVVRIAVHSQWQRHGVGRWLLQQLEQQAQQFQISLLGSVFAASSSVLSFWQHCGFEAVRLGITREATSGAFPVMVVKALNADGSALADAARHRFEQNFLYSLADTPEPWPVELIVQAWQKARFPLGDSLSAADEKDVRYFVEGHKTLENTAVALTRQLCRWMAGGLLRALNLQEQQLLIAKLLQKRPWPEVAALTGCSGHKQARKQLQAVVAKLMMEKATSSEV